MRIPLEICKSYFYTIPNINSHAIFQPILDLVPHLSLGLRWEPHHGEAWRFADSELLLMELYGAFYGDSGEQSIDRLRNCREQLLEHYKVFSSTYLEASLLNDSVKNVLLEKLNIMDQWIQMIDLEIQERNTEAA